MDGNNAPMLFIYSGILISGSNKIAFLKKITDKDTQISLRGCSTAPAADALAKYLGNGATVSGNYYYSSNIPWTPWDVSIWWKNFSYPPPPLDPAASI